MPSQLTKSVLKSYFLSERKSSPGRKLAQRAVGMAAIAGGSIFS